MTDNPDTSVHPAAEQVAHDDHDTAVSAPDPFTAPAESALESEPDAGAEETPTTVAAQPAPTSNMPPVVANDSITRTPPSAEIEQLSVEVEDRPRQRQVTWAWTSLQAMFPDFDEAVLISVLESVGGDQERAIDTLLGMSDPNYIPASQAPQPVTPISSQTDLDEQLARRLMLEEQMEHQASFRPQQQGPIPYDPRVHRGRPPPQQQVPPGGERDTMTEFQEQFSRIAETGKKTFGSLISKVKAKMSEFDQSRAGGQASTSHEPRWDSGGSNTYPQRETFPAYYDPNPPTEQSRSFEHYEISTPQPPLIAPDPVYAAPTALVMPANSFDAQLSERSHSPLQISSTAAETPPPPQTSTGTPPANIDPGKLGLLPKRPVSLLQPVSVPTRQDSEDDELEYVENPFEEGDK